MGPFQRLPQGGAPVNLESTLLAIAIALLLATSYHLDTPDTGATSATPVIPSINL